MTSMYWGQHGNLSISLSSQTAFDFLCVYHYKDSVTSRVGYKLVQELDLLIPYAPPPDILMELRCQMKSH